MVSLDDFLSGPKPPPRPPIPWVKVIVTSLALAASLAVLGYVMYRGEQSARSIWLQVGKNLDRRDKPTDTAGGRSYGSGRQSTPTLDAFGYRNSIVEALERAL